MNIYILYIDSIIVLNTLTELLLLVYKILTIPDRALRGVPPPTIEFGSSSYSVLKYQATRNS